MDDSSDRDSVPGLLMAIRLGMGGGQEVAQFWVGKESISALITSGSHHDCSLWRNSICCHHRREALRAVRGFTAPTHHSAHKLKTHKSNLMS